MSPIWWPVIYLGVWLLIYGILSGLDLDWDDQSSIGAAVIWPITLVFQFGVFIGWLVRLTIRAVRK